jgi:hypothetical protein
MSHHQLNTQRLNKFKKQWLIEEGEDIDALNNSILASCVPDSQTFLDHDVLSIMKVFGELVKLLLPKKGKETQL